MWLWPPLPPDMNSLNSTGKKPTKRGRRSLFRTKTSKEREEDIDRNQLGLTTVYDPPGEEIVADLVFVHGLGGGSRKTWSKNGDPSLFWPQEWLPKEVGFENVRIHTFGYDSGWKSTSTLSILDFARSLGFALLHDMPFKRARPPLILIGHSLGGLIIKQTYIQARQMPGYGAIVESLKAILFLATPHRGSNVADTLSRIINIASPGKLFIQKLNQDSQAIQSINEDFIHVGQDLQLWSFYETQATSSGIRQAIVVERGSAVLGFSQERVQPLNANHRDICKFSAPNDSNYLVVRNALAAAISTHRDLKSTESPTTNRRLLLEAALNNVRSTKSNLHIASNQRLEGSCQWLLSENVFRAWRDSETLETKMIWFYGAPGSGKSVLARFIIEHLKELNLDCSFHFFSHEDQSIAAFLREVACQLAELDPGVFDVVVKFGKESDRFGIPGHQTLWRRLFLNGILKIPMKKQQYWVIDAIDESIDQKELLSYLSDILKTTSIRILLTSRSRPNLPASWRRPYSSIDEIHIDRSKTHNDLAMYIQTRLDSLHFDPSIRRELAARILVKSNGSFLWTRLVFDELEQVYTMEAVHNVLESVPSDMNALYTRIFTDMLEKPQTKALAIAIMMWTSCSARPLTIVELSSALQIDTSAMVVDLARYIDTVCGQILCIDEDERVRFIHATAREFVCAPESQLLLSFDRHSGHGRIARVCLKYLLETNLTGAEAGKPSSKAGLQHPFADYASTCLYEHILHASSDDSDLHSAIGAFLTSRKVLSWIEYVARISRLEILTKQGQVLKRWAEHRRARFYSSLDEVTVTIESWADDLVRLAARFGHQLIESPASIHHLIPSLCPPESAVFKQFGNSPGSVQVLGLPHSTWDDCLSTIRYSDERAHAIACTSNYFAVSLSSGRIMIYEASLCQHMVTLDHGGPARVLLFGETSSLDILASADNQCIKIWDVDSWRLRFEFPLNSPCLALAFLEPGALSAALRSNAVITWDLQSGDLVTHTDWALGLSHDQKFRIPQHAVFCVKSKLLAVGYRDQDLIIYDLELDAFHNTFSHEVGIMAIASCHDRLAILYINTDLIIFDTSTSVQLAKITTYATVIASSPVGRILATADPMGTIELFDVDTLALMYRISTSGDSILSLAFTLDCQRLLDIRAGSCNVWQPIVLNRQDTNLDGDESDGYLAEPQSSKLDLTLDQAIITAIYTDLQDEVIFAGKDDGSVWTYRAKLHSNPQFLFRQTTGMSITCIAYDVSNRILTIADASGRLTCRHIANEAGKIQFSVPIFDAGVSNTITQVTNNKDCSRMLVSSLTSDVMFKFDDARQSPLDLNVFDSIRPRLLSKEAESTLYWDTRTAYTWEIHPTLANTLVLFMNGVIHLYTWDNLEQLTPEHGISFSTGLASEVSVQAIRAHFHERICVITLETTQVERNHYICLLVDLSDLKTQSSVVLTRKYLSRQIEHFIGSFRDKLIFLDSSGWICSTMTQSNNYLRHFFIPADWLNTGCARMMTLTRHGGLVFVKSHEVIIINKGLGIGETICDIEVNEHVSLTGRDEIQGLSYHAEVVASRITNDTQIHDRGSIGSNLEAYNSSSDQCTNSIDCATDQKSVSSAISRSMSSTSMRTYGTEITHYSKKPKVSIEAELINLLVNHETFQPLYVKAMSKPDVGSDRFFWYFSRSLKSYARDLQRKAESRSQIATAQLVHVRFQFIAQSVRRRYDPDAHQKGGDMFPELTELPVQSVAETVDRFLDKTYGPLGLQGGAVGDIVPSFPTKHSQVREMPSNARDNHDESSSIRSEPLSDSFDQAPDLYRYPENFDSFREVKLFLTSGEPFENLEKCLKELVEPLLGPKPVPDILPPTSEAEEPCSTTAYNSIRAIIEGVQRLAVRLDLIEGPVPPGYTRIEWTCACGAKVHDDFLELRVGALDELKATLAATNKSHSLSTSGTNGTKGSQSIGVFNSIRTIFNSFRSPAAQKGLPTNTSPATKITTQAQAATTTSAHLYLLSCLDQGSFGVKMHHELLTDVKNDLSLFQFLRDTYKQRQSLRSMLSMKTIRSLNLVRFSVDMSQYVDIKWHHAHCSSAQCVCLPPDNIVGPSTPAEYHCKPVPASYIPPMGKNYLMHYLRHPRILNPQQTWVYNQLPKRLCGQLLAPNNEQVTGWGMHFEEGISWRAWGLLGFGVIVVGSCVFGILWGVLKDDVQTGFTVAAYWSNIATVILGFWAVRLAVRVEG